MRRSLPECLPDGRTRFTRALAVPVRPQAPEPPGAFLTVEPASPAPGMRQLAGECRRLLCRRLLDESRKMYQPSARIVA